LQAFRRRYSRKNIYDVHSDHLDTPKMLTDDTGAVRWRAGHEAFGKAHADEDPDGDSTDVTFNLRFPGQYYDAESGLHYNRMRYYAPELGRYVSADPIGQFSSLALDGVALTYPGIEARSGVYGPADANLYAYTRSNPMQLADPFGLWSVTVTVFSGGWGGYGVSATIGGDDSGGFIDVIAGVGVGGGFSYDPNGTAPINTDLAPLSHTVSRS
jgi:RHS repeat-associated protein